MPAPYPLSPEHKAILPEPRKAFGEVHRATNGWMNSRNGQLVWRSAWHEVCERDRGDPRHRADSLREAAPGLNETTTRAFQSHIEGPSRDSLSRLPSTTCHRRATPRN
jgi:hypothetical protein